MNFAISFSSMNEIKNGPYKNAPTGSTTAHDGLRLNPPKSMMLPATNPVMETAKRVFGNVVIIHSVSLNEHLVLFIGCLNLAWHAPRYLLETHHFLPGWKGIPRWICKLELLTSAAA